METGRVVSAIRERRVTCDWSKMLEGEKVLGQDWGEGGDGIAGMGGQVR